MIIAQSKFSCPKKRKPAEEQIALGSSKHILLAQDRSNLLQTPYHFALDHVEKLILATQRFSPVSKSNEASSRK
jgi:hypothetical protein